MFTTWVGIDNPHEIWESFLCCGTIDNHNIKIHISIFAFNFDNTVENNVDNNPSFYIIVLQFVDACAILQHCAHLMDWIYMPLNQLYSTCLRWCLDMYFIVFPINSFSLLWLLIFGIFHFLATRFDHSVSSNSRNDYAKCRYYQNQKVILRSSRRE